ncbi:mutase [Lithospermum erythrorhizon]|uniref:Mutase n=1 Tax=Lithospermum erythrorhizon TaxID=34254 RepID=A0AAV3P0M2_LITER
MSKVSINNEEIDIVIGAVQADLTSFLEDWRPFISKFHLIIVQDPDLKGEPKIPDGFKVDVYTKSKIDQTVGASAAALFSGYSCRYFGYLMSRKKYVISIDDDCTPAKDTKGNLVDAIAQHINNLKTPATPFFFNTLYDPFCKGADFVRGYPFSMREGVPCGLSCGLWLNLADYDAPTQALKPGLKNTRYVDAVLTVPVKTFMPVSGINIAFNRELLGPVLFSSFKLEKEGKYRYETMEDIWTGMSVKLISDHLGIGVKTGLPYVSRKERGNAIESLKKEGQGVNLMEQVLPFFQSLSLSKEATTAEDCVKELAAAVKERLGQTDAGFAKTSETMLEWLKIWSANK